MSKPFFKYEYMDENNRFCGIYRCKHPENKHNKKCGSGGSCAPCSCPIPETQGQIRGEGVK